MLLLLLFLIILYVPKEEFLSHNVWSFALLHVHLVQNQTVKSEQIFWEFIPGIYMFPYEIIHNNGGENCSRNSE